MAIVMKCHGLANGKNFPFMGHYLKEYRLEPAPAGELVLTPEISEAKGFANVGEAFEYLHQIPHHTPTRPDGRQNKPLTAYHWESLIR